MAAVFACRDRMRRSVLCSKRQLSARFIGNIQGHRALYPLGINRYLARMERKLGHLVFKSILLIPTVKYIKIHRKLAFRNSLPESALARVFKRNNSVRTAESDNSIIRRIFARIGAAVQIIINGITPDTATCVQHICTAFQVPSLKPDAVAAGDIRAVIEPTAEAVHRSSNVFVCRSGQRKLFAKAHRLPAHNNAVHGQDHERSSRRNLYRLAFHCRRIARGVRRRDRHGIILAIIRRRDRLFKRFIETVGHGKERFEIFSFHNVVIIMGESYFGHGIDLDKNIRVKSPARLVLCKQANGDLLARMRGNVFCFDQ